jgi:hypothetical protein
MRSVLLSTLTACGFAVVACSLSVPSEDAVFGKYTAGSGGKTGSGGEIASSGGSSGEHASGGTADGGMPGGGGTSPIAGTSSGGNSTGGSAPGGGSGGEAGAPVIVLPPATLFIHYTFDDVSSGSAKDSSGNGKDAVLTGVALPTGVAGHIAGAIHLDASKQQYVQLPGDILVDMDAVSITAWLELDSGAPWDRLFDFNATGTGNWFYFSPTGWNSAKTPAGPGTHIAVKGPLVDPEMMLNEVFPVGTWHHVAVVLAPPFLRYYLDGKLKSELNSMTVAPKDVGKTYQNWIGRSPYPADPYLNGLVDDFRMYAGALKDSEIKDLAAQ